MTPGERVYAAISGLPVDRLAVATYNCHGFSFGQHARCPEYRPILEAVARTGAGVLCKVAARKSGGLPAPEVTEKVEADERVVTAVLHTPDGALRTVTREPPGQPARCVEPYVKTDRDMARFCSLRPTPVRWDIDDLLDRCREIGDAGVAYLGYADPFASVVTLFGQEDFLIRIHTDPEPILGMIRWSFDRIRDELRSLLEALPPAAKVLFYTGGPEYATPPLMPPEVFARAITPFHSRLVAMIHEHGRSVSLHCHGRVRQVLEEILTCGFDVLEPCEPPPQGDIDLAALRAGAGQRLCLMGYVQDQDLYTAPGRIRAHVEEVVGIVGRSSRYVATPTCTPFQFPPTPRYVANYIAFLDAAAELGAPGGLRHTGTR